MKQDKDKTTEEQGQQPDAIQEAYNRSLDDAQRRLEDAKRNAEAIANAIFEESKANIEFQRGLAEQQRRERQQLEAAPICRNCRWWHNPDGLEGGEHPCRYNCAGNWIYTSFNNRCGKFAPKDGQQPERCKTCRHWHDARFSSEENPNLRNCTAYPRVDFRDSKADAEDYCGQHEPTEKTEEQ